MRVIIGYKIDEAHIKGVSCNVRHLQANMRFLQDLLEFGGLDLVKDYLRLEEKGRLQEYSLRLDRLPISCKKLLYVEDGQWVIDDLQVKRRIIAENDPLKNLSPEEKKILRKIKSGRD